MSLSCRMRPMAYAATLAVLASSGIAAQAVVLPAVRTIGPSPAQQKLLQMSTDAAQWYKPGENADAATIQQDAQRQLLLDYARFRFLLAPLSSHALAELACHPSEEALWSQFYNQSGAVAGPEMNAMLAAALRSGPLSMAKARNAALLQLALKGLENVDELDGVMRAVALGDRDDGAAEKTKGSAAVGIAKAWIDSATKALKSGDFATAGALTGGAAQLLADAAGHFSKAAARLASLSSDLKQISAEDDLIVQAGVGMAGLLASADTLNAIATRLSKANAKTDSAVLVAAADSLVTRGKFVALLPGTGPIPEVVQASLQAKPLARHILKGRRSDARTTANCEGSANPILTVDEAETIQIGSALAIGESDATRKGNLDDFARAARLVVIERELNVHLLPVRSSDQAYEYWRQSGVSPLNVGSVIVTGTGAAAMTEVLAPMVHAVRLSLNAVVAGSKASSPTSSSTAPTTTSGTGTQPASSTTTNGNSTDALAQFVSAGGQLNANAALPLISVRDRQKESSATLLFVTRTGGTSGTLGSAQSDATAYIDPGLDLHVNTLDVISNIGVFAQARFGAPTVGQALRTSLNVPRSFGYLAIGGGLIIGGKYQISAAKTVGSPASIAKTKWQWGITVISAAQ